MNILPLIFLFLLWLLSLLFFIFTFLLRLLSLPFFIFTFLLRLLSPSSAHTNEAEFIRADKAYMFGDYQTAFPIFKTLAKQGHADAQYFLGSMYDLGLGTSQNYGEALRWYRKVAEQGDASAQYELGRMYYEGKGVSQNYIKAYMWTSIAKVNGDKEAKELLEDIEKKMDSANIIEAQKLATQCLESNYQNCDE